MKGILTDNVEADSDCIVTAVFLGLAVQSGKGLQISVDPTEAKDKLPALEKTMAKVNTALKSLNPKHTDVKSVKAPDQSQGSTSPVDSRPSSIPIRSWTLPRVRC